MHATDLIEIILLREPNVFSFYPFGVFHLFLSWSKASHEVHLLFQYSSFSFPFVLNWFYLSFQDFGVWELYHAPKFLLHIVFHLFFIYWWLHFLCLPGQLIFKLNDLLLSRPFLIQRWLWRVFCCLHIHHPMALEEQLEFSHCLAYPCSNDLSFLTFHAVMICDQYHYS